MHAIRLIAVAVALLVAAESLAQSGGASLVGIPAKAGAVRGEALAHIQGNALTSTGTALPDSVVRLRDARSGRIVATIRSDEAGLFAFHQVEPGSYIVELVGADAQVLAASQILDLNAGETASAIVKLPFRLQPYAGVLGHTVASALLVTATAAATGVLASQVAGEPVSPRR